MARPTRPDGARPGKTSRPARVTREAPTPRELSIGEPELGVGPAANLSQIAYARLREAIEEGTIAPGRRLMETQVSAWLQVSRTPAREALRRLEAEGLLVYGPAGGLSVAVHDGAAVTELYAMREVLEGAAAAMAARDADPMEIEGLRAQVRAQAALPPDARVHAGENKLFHESIFRAAHNRFLVKAVQALHDAMALLGRTTFEVPGRIASSIAEHRAIVEAIATRDPAAAEAAARLHIRHGYDSRVRVMTEALHEAAVVRSQGAAPLPPEFTPSGHAARPRRPSSQG